MKKELLIVSAGVVIGNLATDLVRTAITAITAKIAMKKFEKALREECKHDE